MPDERDEAVELTQEQWDAYLEIVEACSTADGLCLALASRDAEIARLREREGPWDTFRDWAQEYLDAGRWAGFHVADAVRQEILERDQEIARLRERLDAVISYADMCDIGTERPHWCAIARRLARGEE